MTSSLTMIGAPAHERMKLVSGTANPTRILLYIRDDQRLFIIKNPTQVFNGGQIRNLISIYYRSVAFPIFYIRAFWQY